MAQYFFTDEGAPTTTPAVKGAIYIDTTNDRAYISTDTGSSSDWDLMPANISELAIDADINFGGNYKAINLKGIDFQTFTEYTISSGVIAPVQSLASIDTEGDASSDDIDTITFATNLNMVGLKMENAARVPTLKHGTGNLSLPNGADVIMVADVVYWFIYDGSSWLLAFDPAGVAVTFPVTDATTLLKGSIDDTKKVRFEADTNTPTATTIVISTPSNDFDMEEAVRNSGSGTDNAIVRFNASGVQVQDSGVTIDDSENLSGVAKISSSDHIQLAEIAAPSTPASGNVALYTKIDGKLYIKDDTGTETDCTGSGGGGSGDVSGPASAVDENLAVFDSTTGKLIKDATVNISAVTANTAKLTADETNVVSALDGATLSAVTVAGTDKVIIQDVSDSDNIKTVTAQSIADLGGGGTDADAIHDNVANEITAITEKTSVSALDEYVQEDSDASFVKKSIKHKTLVQVVPTTETGTTYTLAIDDIDVTMNNASANVVTIPTNASIAFPVNTVISVTQLDGATTITGDTGVTVNGVSAGSIVIGSQYGATVLTKTATDTWVGTVGASSSGGNFPPSTNSSKTADYTVVSGDVNTRVTLAGSVVANHTFTLDVSLLSIGEQIVFYNNSAYRLAIEVSNTSTMTISERTELYLWRGETATVSGSSSTKAFVIARS